MHVGGTFMCDRTILSAELLYNKKLALLHSGMVGGISHRRWWAQQKEQQPPKAIKFVIPFSIFLQKASKKVIVRIWYKLTCPKDFSTFYCVFLLNIIPPPENQQKATLMKNQILILQLGYCFRPFNLSRVGNQSSYLTAIGLQSLALKFI